MCETVHFPVVSVSGYTLSEHKLRQSHATVVFEPCIWWSLGLGGQLGLHNDRDVATTRSIIGDEQESKTAVGKQAAVPTVPCSLMSAADT